MQIHIMHAFVINTFNNQQALTKAYSRHYLGQKGLLAKVNYCKNSSIYTVIYPVLTWSQFRPDMHQDFMVCGQDAKYEYHSAIHV